MSTVADALRRAVRERATGRCEYCLAREIDFNFAHEADHIVAEQHGGAAVMENLALACMRCNRRKGTNLASIDPESGQPTWLFHPRRDRWADHFRLEEGRIVGRTPAGRTTAFLLRLNTADRVELRRRLAQAGCYPREQ